LRLVRAIEARDWTATDLAAIGAAVSAARQRGDPPAAEPAAVPSVGSGGPPPVRLGGYWLELKYIPDRSGQWEYGPYLYARWREGGRQRSRYIGKRPAP
jgi:hypothetical protein